MTTRASKFNVRFETDGEGRVIEALTKVEKVAKKAGKEIDETGDAAKRSASKYKDLEKAATRAGTIIGTALVGAVALLVYNTGKAQNEQAQLAAVLKSTGDAAGFSQAKLNAMAETLDRTTHLSAGQINDAQTRLLSYTNIVGVNFPRALQIAIDQSARLGIGIEQSAELIGRALQEPEKAMVALGRQGFYFSESQKEVIEHLVETGQVAKAQAEVMVMLEESYDGASAALRGTLLGSLGDLGDSFNELMTADTGLPAFQESIEDLTATLRDDETKQAFDALIGYLASTINFAVQGTVALNGMADAFEQMMTRREDKTYLGLLASRGGVADDLADAQAVAKNEIDRGYEVNPLTAHAIEVFTKDLAALDQLITERREALRPPSTVAPELPRITTLDPVVVTGTRGGGDGTGNGNGPTRDRQTAVDPAVEAHTKMLEREAKASGLSADAWIESGKALEARNEEIARGQEAADMQIRSMREELDILGLQGPALERAIALRYVDADATGAQRAEIGQLAEQLYAAREAQAVLGDIKGALSDLLVSGASDIDNLGDAFESFAERLQKIALRMAADKLITWLFGMLGGSPASAPSQEWAAGFGNNTGWLSSGDMTPDGHATGGKISGPGTSTSDSIPARLSDGEWVINAAAVDKYGDGFMAAINNGQLAMLANGGPASGGGAGAMMGGGGDVNVTVYGAPGEANVNATRNRNGGLDIEVIFQQMEGRLAGNVAGGAGPLYTATKSRFHLRDGV